MTRAKWKARFGSLFLVLVGVVFAVVAGFLIANPAQCDRQPMQSGDYCAHFGRTGGSQKLIPATASWAEKQRLVGRARTVNDVAAQRRSNRNWAWFYALTAVTLLGLGALSVVPQVRKGVVPDDSTKNE